MFTIEAQVITDPHTNEYAVTVTGTGTMRTADIWPIAVEAFVQHLGGNRSAMVGWLLETEPIFHEKMETSVTMFSVTKNA